MRSLLFFHIKDRSMAGDIPGKHYLYAFPLSSRLRILSLELYDRR
jgi:hypothetical protein